jgi:dienelactone hydrolase
MKSALTIAFVLTACVSFAQGPGRGNAAQGPGRGGQANLVGTTLPLEGAPKAIPGPYKVIKDSAFGSAGHVVFRPEDLGAFPRKDKLPVMAWGDGGCAINSARYSGFFETIASHGFLVIGSVPEPGAANRQQSADDLRKAIAWAEKENTRDGSPLKGKVDLEHVAVMGQSCGGFLSITLGADPRVKTIGVFNSGVQPNRAESNGDALQKVHGPVLLINGAERDFLTPVVTDDVRAAQQSASVLRRPPRRRPHRHSRSSGRRRICERRVELAAVAIQERQESGDDVRRRQVRPLHEQQLGRSREGLQRRRATRVRHRPSIAAAVSSRGRTRSTRTPSRSARPRRSRSRFRRWKRGDCHRCPARSGASADDRDSRSA